MLFREGGESGTKIYCCFFWEKSGKKLSPRCRYPVLIKFKLLMSFGNLSSEVPWSQAPCYIFTWVNISLLYVTKDSVNLVNLMGILAFYQREVYLGCICSKCVRHCRTWLLMQQLHQVCNYNLIIIYLPFCLELHWLFHQFHLTIIVDWWLDNIVTSALKN